MKQAYTFCSSELNSETISEKMRRKEILDMPSDTFTFDLSLSSLINQQSMSSVQTMTAFSLLLLRFSFC